MVGSLGVMPPLEKLSEEGSFSRHGSFPSPASAILRNDNCEEGVSDFFFRSLALPREDHYFFLLVIITLLFLPRHPLVGGPVSGLSQFSLKPVVSFQDTEPDPPYSSSNPPPLPNQGAQLAHCHK